MNIEAHIAQTAINSSFDAIGEVLARTLPMAAAFGKDKAVIGACLFHRHARMSIFEIALITYGVAKEDATLSQGAKSCEEIIDALFAKVKKDIFTDGDWSEKIKVAYAEATEKVDQEKLRT